jgi:hypothetical protein
MFRFSVCIYHLEEQHFETLRAAVDFYDMAGRLGHIWKFGHAATDEGDTGLTEDECDAVDAQDGEGRDALIAVIDAIAAHGTRAA